MGSLQGEHNTRTRQRFASIEAEIHAQRILIETEFERQRQQYVYLRSNLMQLLASIADNAQLFEIREQEADKSPTDNTSSLPTQQQHVEYEVGSSETVVVLGTLEADKFSTPATDLIDRPLQKDTPNSPPSSKTSIIETKGHLVRGKNNKPTVRPLCDLLRQFLRSRVLPAVTVDDFRAVGRLTGISCDELNPDSEDDAVGLVERMLRREMGGHTDQLLNDPSTRKRFEAKLSKRKTGASRSGRASIQALLSIDVLNSSNPYNGSLWRGVEEALETAGDIPMAETSLDTVLCIDTSESISATALRDIKNFLRRFINGLEETAEKHDIEENVALVTFGGRPRVLHHLTNDYGSLRDAIENIRPRGHSPLLQGLLYSLACITKGGVCKFGLLKVPPRIVFITDGQASSENHQHSADNRHVSEKEKTRLLSVASVLSSDRSKQDIACPLVWVPVGDANNEFLRQMASVSDGTYTSPNDLRTLCNYQKIKRVSANVLNYMKSHADNPRMIDTVIDAFGLDLRYDDKVEVARLVHSILYKDVFNMKSLDRFDNININENLPPLGSRVVRGPDWMWDNQDSGLAGTVYNHGQEGESVWVLWDNGFRNVYRCGAVTGYDVLPTDQPRQLLPGRLIDVGVQVERGPDWSHKNQDGGPGSCGVVIRVRGLRVKVLWGSGEIHEYRFGEENKFEVSVRNLMNEKERKLPAPTPVKATKTNQRTVPMEQEPSPPHHGMEPTVTAVQASSALDIDADPEGFESLTMPISRPQRNPSTPSNTLNARFQTIVKSAYVSDHGSLVIDGVESGTPLHSFSEDQSPCHDGPSLIDLSRTRKVKFPPDAGESGGGASDFSAALSGNERVTSPIPSPEHRQSQRGHLQNFPPSAADQQHEQTFTRGERGSATRNRRHMEQAQQCLHFREVQGRDYYTIDHCCHVVDIKRSDVFGDVSQGTGILLSLTWDATEKHVVHTSWTVALAADSHRDRCAIINQLVDGKFLSLRNLASDIFRSYTAHLVSVTNDLSFMFGHSEEQSANRMIECDGDVYTIISGYLPMDCKFNLQVLKDARYEVSRDASPEECQSDVPADIQLLSDAIQKKMNLSTESREESKEMAEVQAKLAHMESEFKQVESTFRQILKNQKDNSERQLQQLRNDMSNCIGLIQQQPSQKGATQDRVPVDVSEIQEKERGFHSSTVSPSQHDSTYATGETEPNVLDLKSQQVDNMHGMATSNSPTETGSIDIRFMDKAESIQRWPEPTPVNQVSQGSPTVPHSTDMPRDTHLKDDTKNNHLSQHLPTRKSSRQDVNDLVHILPEESLVSAERLLEAFSVSSVGDRRSHPEVKRLAESIALALQEERPPPSRSKGPDTILCLDVSDSIAQHGLEQLKKTANSFIDGIEDIAEQFGLEENIGVVAMGGRSTVVQELTNDFGMVRDAIDNLEVGGRSPLFEALLVCAAALKGRGGILSIGDAHKIRPRLIVVTDGLATSYARWTGSDGGSSDHDTKVKLIQLVQQFTPKNNSSAPHPIVWVPVGKADTGFLKSLAKLGQGELVEGEDMARLCKNYRIQGSIGKILLCIQTQHITDSMSSSIETVAEALVGEMDPAEKSAVVEAVKRKLDHKDTDSDDDDDNMEPNDFKRLREKKALLALGTRVCRGPDWKWGDQDSGGPGTVVNHAKEDNLVWVCWDFNSTFCRYRYGYENNYDLLVQDTARYLCDDELIEIGNKVQRGRDWTYGEQDGGPGSYGVVIRKAQDGKVKVRWIDADKICTYNYGCDGRFDLKICTPDLETRPRKPSPVPVATKEQVWQWQWRDSTGKWRLYDAVTTEKLEKEIQRNAKGSCLIQRNGKSFRVVFKKDPMIEKLVSGNEVHDVRRLAVSDEERGQF